MKRLVVLLLATALLIFAPIPADAATHSLRVMTLNVGGGAHHHGRVKPVKAMVTKLVKRERPDVIGLQEICSNQFAALAMALKGYRTAVFVPTMVRQSCHGGDHEFGNALFVRSASSAPQGYELPWGDNPSGSFARQPRSMLCVDSGDRHICTTHLTVKNPDRRNQIRHVSELLADYDDVVLLGDLNSSRDAARYLSDLRTANPKRRATTDSGKALDWILASRTPHKLKIVRQSRSDHHAVLAEV